MNKYQLNNLSLLNMRQEHLNSNFKYYFISFTFKKHFNANNSCELDDTLSVFACNLDRRVYKKSAQRKCLFIRAAVHETDNRYHVHCILMRPTDIDISSSQMRRHVSIVCNDLHSTANFELLGKKAFQEIETNDEMTVLNYMLKDSYHLKSDAYASVFNAKRHMLEQKFL